MPYQSITPKRLEYAKRDFLGNRSEESDPLGSYHEVVTYWAFKSKKNMHELCQLLLRAAANPPMIARAMDDVGRLAALGVKVQAECLVWYPWDWFRDIETRLKTKQFKRGKYEKVKIPKRGKAGTRTIEVPSVETRIVARSVSNVLVPLIDPGLYPLSIGFRPRRSPLHGIAAAEQLSQQGLTHWVICDIRDAFGQLPKQRCLQILGSRLKNSPIMWLVEELLDRHRTKGVPQGIAISPLMLNVYLDHCLDKWWLKNQPDTVLIRYADDIAVACPSHESAVASYSALKDRINTIGLQIKEELDEAVFDLSAGEHIDWLGFRVRYEDEAMHLSVNDQSWQNLEMGLAEAKHRQNKMEENVCSLDVACIGFGWLAQKAVAFQEAQIPAVADKIRNLSLQQYGLDMSELTDTEAYYAWEAAQERRDKARQEVIKWLPRNVVAN